MDIETSTYAVCQQRFNVRSILQYFLCRLIILVIKGKLDGPHCSREQ